MLSLFIAEHCSTNTFDHWKVIVKNCLIANKTTTIIENIVLFDVSVYASHPAETSNKTMFSIIVAVLFAVRMYSNSVHCLPKKLCVTQKKRYKLQLRATLLKISTERKLWADKRGGQGPYFLPLSIDSECKTKN